MRADIEAGELSKLTYRAAAQYGVKNGVHVKTAQHALRKSGHLVQCGREFIAAA